MPRLRLPVAAGGAAHLVFTMRADGDFAVHGPPDVLESRRRAIVDAPWTWLHQVHGTRVVVVDAPGQHAGAEADAAVTRLPGAPIAVHAADCAPVALVSDDGAIAVVHAGWNGLAAGVIGAAVDAMRAVTAAPCRAVLGPCIHPANYEFGTDDLARVVAAVGDVARGCTGWGTPALDLPAAVRASLAASGVDELVDLGIDTAADSAYYSHRARRDTGRHALVAWIEA